MYPQNQIDTIDFIQCTLNLLEHYVNNQEEVITQRAREIVALKLKCEQIEKHVEAKKQLANIFFEQREQARNAAMSALDIAINKGDADISELALAMLGSEYTKDFFGMINKL